MTADWEELAGFGACGGVMRTSLRLPSFARLDSRGGCPYGILDTNKSPEVMLNSFLSASSSLLDPC
jgi:hypothetical protein